MGLLAVVTWSAAAFHAASSAGIVTASYFTAWISRNQHRLLLFFARYGGAVIDADTPENVAQVDATSQPGTDGWDAPAVQNETPPTTSTPTGTEQAPNMFGGRPPKGQA